MMRYHILDVLLSDRATLIVSFGMGRYIFLLDVFAACTPTHDIRTVHTIRALDRFRNGVHRERKFYPPRRQGREYSRWGRTNMQSSRFRIIKANPGRSLPSTGGG